MCRSLCEYASGEGTYGDKTCLRYTHPQIHMQTCTQTRRLMLLARPEWAKVSRSPKAQGSYRLQLWCVCVLATPLCVSVCVSQGWRWKWQHGEWFSHPSLKRKVRCAMLVIHQDIDSTDGIWEKGERWKRNTKMNDFSANLNNSEADSNSNERLYHKVSPYSFVSYWIIRFSLPWFTSI